MSKSPLRFIQLFEMLSSKEVKSFKNYVSSPYFNTNPRLIKLLEYIDVNQKNHSALTNKLKIFRVIYGLKKEYKEQQVYDHFSFLLRLLENFFAQQDFDNDSPSQQRHLLSALTQKNHESHFQRVFRKGEKGWERHPFRDAHHYLWRFLQYKEGSEFSGKQQKRSGDDYLSPTIQSLDLGFLAYRLKYSCELINRSNILGNSTSEQTESWVEYLFSHLPEEFQEIPVIQIYTQIYLTLKEPKYEEHYHALVGLLNAHADIFPKREVNDMYTYAQNYCIKMINSGRSSYHEHLFQLFQSLLDKKLLIENGIIDHRKYKNIVTVSLRMKEYHWVKSFLDNYKEYIPDNFRENAYHYNLAAYYYEQHMHSQALQLLNQISFSDVYYHLSSRAMVLKIYYELEEENALDSLLDTFRIYLDRNKQISAYQRAVHKNLIRFTKKLNQLRNQFAVLSHEELQSRREKLLFQIEKTAAVANINWLKEKIEEIDS